MQRSLLSNCQPKFWRRLTPLCLGLGLMSMTVVACNLQTATPVMAQERQLKTLTVTGRGTESLQTTITQVRLGVEVSGKTAEEVQKEVARRSTAVVNLLRSRQVDKLETTGISLNPNYNYDGGKQRLIGYVGTNTVSFRIDTTQSGTLIDDAVKAGATRIDGISFIAADNAIATAREAALRKATQEAQKQADTVLRALNLNRKEIVSIQINGANTPPPHPVPYVGSLQRADAKEAPTPVIGGEQEVEASVTLEISY